MFKITIEETRDVRKVIGKEYKPIGQQEEPRKLEHITEESPAKTHLVNVWGYTPETETVRTETRTVFTQEVESMDVSAVIQAINGFRGKS